MVDFIYFKCFHRLQNGWNVKKWFLLGLVFGIFPLLFVQIKDSTKDSIAEAKSNTQIISEGGVMMANNNNQVVVVDIKMPFMSIVTFMVKFAFASIPAALIIYFLIAIFVPIFMGLLRA